MPFKANDPVQRFKPLPGVTELGRYKGKANTLVVGRNGNGDIIVARQSYNSDHQIRRDEITMVFRYAEEVNVLIHVVEQLKKETP